MIMIVDHESWYDEGVKTFKCTTVWLLEFVLFIVHYNCHNLYLRRPIIRPRFHIGFLSSGFWSRMWYKKKKIFFWRWLLEPPWIVLLCNIRHVQIKLHVIRVLFGHFPPRGGVIFSEVGQIRKTAIIQIFKTSQPHLYSSYCR